MINQDGVYYADISAKYNNTAVQGMTMSNYVFDDVHWGLFYAPKLNNDWSDSTRSANQHQTYDYSEFAVIYEILQTREDSQHNHYLASAEKALRQRKTTIYQISSIISPQDMV